MGGNVIKVINQYKLSMIAVALLLFLSFSNAQTFDTPNFMMFEHADKVIHFLMYFGVTSALYIDFAWLSRKKASIVAFAIMVILALLTEVGQEQLTTTRSGDLYDFLINIAGGCAALIIAPATAKLYFKLIDYVRKLI